MSKLIVAVVVVLVGAVAYLVGASFHIQPGPSADAPTGASERAPRPEPAEQDPRYDLRSDALVRELRDENRALRAAINDLTAAIRSARDSPTPLSEPASEHPTPEQWTARLRAREPEVVMETVCRLRETVLVRALKFDAQAESAIGPIVGALDATELQQAQRLQEQHQQMYRRNAERCRAATKELDALRTVDDLARWRVAYADIDF